MSRLHALQGRVNVECPRCKHGLHLHGDEGCRICTADLDEIIYDLPSGEMRREAIRQNPCASDMMKARATAL